MKADTVSSVEIPCFKCLLWGKRAQNMYCNPNKCEKLTEWLVNQVERYHRKIERLKQTVERLEVLERVSVP